MEQIGEDKAERQGRSTESSTIISIGELMQMEQQRIDEEMARREQQRRAHEAALRATRAKREQALALEREAAEQERRQRERAEMEEAAALAGKILGFISRAKVQAEHEADAQKREREHQRTLELQGAKHDARVGVLRFAVIALSVGALAIAGGLVGAYAGIIAPDHDRQVAILHAQLAETRDDTRSLSRELEQQRELLKEERRNSARVQAELASTKRNLEQLQHQDRQGPAVRIPGPPGGSSEPGDPPPPAEPCPVGDPMCPHIEP
ncbi:MAG: hypothetical protein ACOC1F_03665 [Myxococcota bacterium]